MSGLIVKPFKRYGSVCDEARAGGVISVSTQVDYCWWLWQSE